jgi:flagellar hook-associated protein 3 FlgL
MRVSTNLIHMQGLQNILEQQAKLVRSQDQLGKGEKLLVPSDDPNAAARIVDLNEAVSQIGQFEENANYATQRLNLEETTLNSVNNVLQRVRELAIQAGNTGTYDLRSEQAIASEIREKLDELLDYANTRDESGDYLFSGYQSSVQAFTTDGQGNYFYNGDEGQLAMQIGSNRQVIANDSGAEIFQLVRQGNGTFAVDAHTTNGGSARISTGSLVDPSAYQAHDFTIEFAEVVPATVPPQYEYDVIDETTGTTVLAAQAYTDGGVIAFNGVQVEISGAPVDGDSFSVRASRNQDIFTSLHELITALETPGSGNVRGSIGGDYINNGFDAGETISFDLNFDGRTINVSVATGGAPTNTTISAAIMASIATDPNVTTNADGSLTLAGTTPGVSSTFQLNGTDINFISDGSNGTNVSSLVVNNLTDLGTGDAVLATTSSGNTVASAATIDAAVAGDAARFAPGDTPRPLLSQRIDNALNNIDRSMDRVVEVTTSIGGRLNSIDSQADDNADRKLHLQTVLSDIRDLDYAEAISNMTFQTSVLQIAQQTFVRVQNLNLFQFL